MKDSVILSLQLQAFFTIHKVNKEHKENSPNVATI